MCPPEEVEDGGRNEWTKQCVLRMKWAGVCLADAATVMELLCELLPGHEHSRNVRELSQKMQSYYFHRRELIGIRDRDILPQFILVLLAQIEKNRDKVCEPKRPSKSYTKKGEDPPGPSLPPRNAFLHSVKVLHQDPLIVAGLWSRLESLVQETKETLNSSGISGSAEKKDQFFDWEMFRAYLIGYCSDGLRAGFLEKVMSLKDDERGAFCFDRIGKSFLHKFTLT